MRFSAATMAILALSAHSATAARINGVIGEELEYQLTKNRELYPKASKKAKAASKAASKKTKEAFSCGVSGTSSKSSKKSTSDDDSCDTPTSVECYGRYKGTVTLTTGLVCFLADEGRTFGIIMDGPDAVLDCAGNDVVVNGVDGFFDDFFVYPAAIVLRNGATAMNCKVHSGEGNRFGVLIDEGDATLIDSHICNTFLGVFISGDGCRTLTNVRTSGNEQTGVFIVNATDTIVMTNLEANGNDRYGVAVDLGVAVVADEETTLNLVMDGAELNSNGLYGLVVLVGNGNVDVELFGTVRAIGNEVYGIATGGASTLTVNGKLQASSNEIGINLIGGSELVIPKSGSVIACGNGEDIDVASTDQIINEDGLLISDSGFGGETCAASAPPNQVAECELELEES